MPFAEVSSSRSLSFAHAETKVIGTVGFVLDTSALIEPATP